MANLSVKKVCDYIFKRFIAIIFTWVYNSIKFTTIIDTKTDKLIRKGLKEDLPNITKIVIAQRISSIEDADKIIVLDDGEISAIGTHEELLKKSKIYKEVYETQNRVGGTN